MRKRKGASRLEAGFTIVELMVVIGIIVVLAALLFPALAAARARGREGQCISQLRQIGKAFRMYLDDHEYRPPRLYHLWPRYVSDKRLFVCPADAWVKRGGWAWSTWGRESTPSTPWPFPISYGYFFGPHTRTSPRWQQAQATPGRPGYVVCVLHGEREGGPHGELAERTGEAPFFHGRTLRLCFDGSVIAVNVSYGRTLFNTWKAMTDQEKPPGAP